MQYCLYNDHCGQSIDIYQATCLLTNKPYIGNTQQQVKKPMEQHIQDTHNLFLKNKKSDSFASHFAQLIPTNLPPCQGVWAQQVFNGHPVEGLPIAPNPFILG